MSSAGAWFRASSAFVVDLRYERRKPFPFTGTIKKVVFDVKPHASTKEAHELHTAVHHGHTAHALTA